MENYKGQFFKTKKYGDLVITDYRKWNDVSVKFVNTNYETVTSMSQIKKGEVRDRSSQTVYGVGVVGDEVTKVDSKHTKEYNLWSGLLERCYCKVLKEKRPTYEGCSVSENFRYFTYFKEWCNKQVGFNLLDDKGKPFHLDKDVLVKGNKVYSEDTCCFVPQEINTLFTKSNKARGDFLIGVRYDKTYNRFIARIRKHGKLNHIGCFKTELEAFYAYKEAKENYIKEVANKWKDIIDIRVYDALMNYEVEIAD